MKLIHNIWVLLTMVLCMITACNGQTASNTQRLILEKEIALPGVKGRIDHIDVNIKDQIGYIAALGNNTIEVVDLKAGKVIHSIEGLSEPQGVAYIEKHNEIFVANGGTGQCDFYNSLTFKKIAGIKLISDADDVRYDTISDKIYVGYGDGGIAVIDAGSHRQIGDIKLPAHPESFQFDVKEGKLWVNLPGAGMIGVIDLKQARLIGKWKRLFPHFNFPMAYDNTGHRIMVGYRLPAILKVFDSNTGDEIFGSGIVSDADDLYWDALNKEIIISGGGGAINIFKQSAGKTYQLVADIKTPKGARTSLFVPQLRLFLLAVRENDEKPATLRLFRLN